MATHEMYRFVSLLAALVQLLSLTPAQIPDLLERMGKFIGAVTVLLGIVVMLIGA